jgi:hypothetical protein
MTNEEKIKKIRQWQWSPWVHPLTCGRRTCNHTPLRAIEKDGAVILECLNRRCDYEQRYIPKIVLETDIEELEKDADKMIEEMNKRTKEKNG